VGGRRRAGDPEAAGLTARALTGLLALNVAYAFTGIALLWALRGLRTWSHVARLAGLGYLMGVAAFGILWTLLLVVDVPFGGVAIVVSLGGIAAAATVAGRLRRSAIPRGWPTAVTGPVVLVTAAGLALAGLLLEALLRSARLQSLQAYDAWAFWVPKAKAIYFFGGLDEQAFTNLPGPSYPPLLPILDAAAFHAMGSADVVTLHVQFWLLVAGGVAAVAGCLHRHVPAWLLWPSLLLILVVPRFSGRLLIPQADVLVDIFFVVATLLVALWLRDAEGWRLGSAALLLGGAALTKREGLVFGACVLLVAFGASWTRRRREWWRLFAVSAFVVAAILPWRLWYADRGISSDAPTADEAGGDRLLDSLRLSVEVLYDNALWSVVPIVASIALAAAALWGDRRLTAFLGLVLALVFAGGVWSTYGYPELPITADEAVNPIVRYTGAIVLLAGCATPLLLARVWARPGEEP
jgi:hypothetical protein